MSLVCWGQGTHDSYALAEDCQGGRAANALFVPFLVSLSFAFANRPFRAGPSSRALHLLGRHGLMLCSAREGGRGNAMLFAASSRQYVCPFTVGKQSCDVAACCRIAVVSHAHTHTHTHK